MDEEREEWMNFLQRRGTLHLIVDMGEEPRTFAELEDRATIKKSALSKRLKAGRKLDVWQKTLVETDDGGDEEVYELERNGQRVFDQLKKMDAVEASKQARDHLDVVFRARETLMTASDPTSNPESSIRLFLALRIAQLSWLLRKRSDYE